MRARGYVRLPDEPLTPAAIEAQKYGVDLAQLTDSSLVAFERTVFAPNKMLAFSRGLADARMHYFSLFFVDPTEAIAKLPAVLPGADRARPAVSWIEFKNPAKGTPTSGFALRIDSVTGTYVQGRRIEMVTGVEENSSARERRPVFYGYLIGDPRDFPNDPRPRITDSLDVFFARLFETTGELP